MGTLRRILEQSEQPYDAPPQPKTTQAATRLQRTVFASSLAVFFLFGAAGGGMFLWAHSFVTDLPQAKINQINRETFDKIDRASLAEFWNVWNNEVIAYPVGEWVESGLVVNRHSAQLRRTIGIALFCVAGLGVVTMIGSWFLRPK